MLLSSRGIKEKEIMKNLIIMAITIFAFATSAVFAGDNRMDFGNAFSYSKSTQSAGSAGSAGSNGSTGSTGSAGSAPGSFQGASGAILIGLGILVLVCIAVCGGGKDQNYSMSPSPM